MFSNMRAAAVRVIHLPTGIMKTCDSERSQFKNKQKALEELERAVKVVTLNEAPKPPRRFFMRRKIDETGISGTGFVVEGVVFHNGVVAAQWITDTTSTGIYRTMEEFVAIHVDGHGEGANEIVWVD